MIYIDFQGGAHGNFLEFVCNKFLANIPTDGNPFNRLGASHNKKYLSEIEFKAGHYFEFRGTKTVFEQEKIISIQFHENDLLAISSISLLRAGDHNIDNNFLHINTYNKWDNINYRHVLNTLIDSFFTNQIRDSYNAVRDPLWPNITNINDFKNLPDWIQHECITQHNLRLLELNYENPDCPRDVLREFFKEGFKNPTECSFIKQQQKMVYDISNDVYVFPFGVFYNTELFSNEIKKIAHWLGYNFENVPEFTELHQEFLSTQPYKNSKSFCDQLLTRINDHEVFAIPKLDLFQESYIAACIELQYNIILPNNESWFTHSREILNCIRAD